MSGHKMDLDGPHNPMGGYLPPAGFFVCGMKDRFGNIKL
jgi:hypothetical protein